MIYKDILDKLETLANNHYFIEQFGYSYFNSGFLYFEASKWNNFLANTNVAEYIKSKNIKLLHILDKYNLVAKIES